MINRIQGGGRRHLELLFCNAGPPRNPFAVLNLPFKFRVDRFYTIRDIAI